MELPDTTSGVPLVLVRSVKMRPGGNLEVLLECTRQLTDQMDIRIDTGFHHKNPNIYIPPCCINNPNNKHNPRYMPLTIFNLSTVDHLYIGKDTVIAFAEQPVLETYNIELASEDKIKEHLAKPQNWVPQRHETLPEILHDTAFLCSLADVPGPCKVQLQDKDITTDIRQKFQELCEEYGEAFSKNNEDISRTKLVKMDIDTGDSPPVSSRPYTLPLKHYEWVQREIESLERAGLSPKVCLNGQVQLSSSLKNQLLGNPQREDYVLISEKSMSYNRRSLWQERPRARFPSIHSQKLMRCMRN